MPPALLNQGESMVQRIDKDRSVFLVIDLQERVLPIQHDADFVIDNVARFATGATKYGIPVMIMEQNPAKLWGTPEIIKDCAQGHTYIEKHTLSCLRDPDFKKVFDTLGRDQLIISGSETQICVQKTSLDAIEAGYDVFVLGDGVTSRTGKNVELGLERLRQAGAIVESTEGALFELIERGDDDDFKYVLGLITKRFHEQP